jgi:hypothetical protein
MYIMKSAQNSEDIDSFQLNSVRFNSIVPRRRQNKKGTEDNKTYSRQGTSKRNSPVLTTNAPPSKSYTRSSCPDCGDILDEFFDLET